MPTQAQCLRLRDLTATVEHSARSLAIEAIRSGMEGSLGMTGKYCYVALSRNLRP